MTTEPIEINPEASPIGSIIWMHGLGADGNDFVPLIPELRLPKNLPLRFIFPQAPFRAVTVNNGYVMRAWYDIVSFDFNQRTDESGLLDSIKMIDALIQKEIERGIPAEKIILAGFSQGAVVALTTGLRYKKRLAGILALSGYLPFPEIKFFESHSENFSLPIFIAHGTEDTVVPFLLGKLIAEALQKYHYSVISWHAYPMAHSVCHEEIQDISRWLQELLLKKNYHKI